MRTAIAASLCVLLLAGTVALAELPAWTKDVAADAKWVIRVDVKALTGSAIGKHLLEQMTTEQRANLAKFTETFGFDPTANLDSVVLYGAAYGPTAGVAVFHGQFDRDKLLKLLAANEGHEESKFGDRVIHRWTQKPEGPNDDGVRFGAFAAEGVIVIGRAKAPVEAALNVLDGKAESLAGAKEAALSDLTPAPAGTFVQAAAKDFRLPEDAPPKAAFLRNMQAGHLLLGEAKDEAFAILAVTATAAETAQKMRQMLTGFVALGQLALAQAEQDGKPAPAWAPLVKGAVIGGEGEVVTARLSLAVKDLIALAEKAKAAKAAAAEAKAAAGETER